MNAATLQSMAKRVPLSIRLTDEEQATVEYYSRHLSMTPTAVVRMALRQLRLRGILLPDPTEERHADQPEPDPDDE